MAQRPGDVRVLENELWVGHHQVGVLIVDGARVTIDDNKVGLNPLAPRPQRLDPAVLNELMRDAIIETLGLSFGETSTESRRAEKQLRAAYRQLVEVGVAGPLTQDQLVKLRIELANRGGTLVSAAAQGIVVAGGSATDVRISNNTVAGASEGIRVAFSRPLDPGNNYPPSLRVERLQIVGNTISLLIPQRNKGAHCGILVGNAYVTTIRDNQVTGDITDEKNYRRGEGIRFWGKVGPVLLILGNTCMKTYLGFRVRWVPGGWDIKDHQWRLSLLLQRQWGWEENHPSSLQHSQRAF